MPNMLDYIAWRGDLTLAQDPMNENDELVLSQLAYVAFGDFIPGFDKPGASVSLGAAAAWLLAYDVDAEKIHQTGFMWKENIRLLEALKDSARFSGMRLFNYRDVVSQVDEKQFAAITVDPGDGTLLIAYRGTDDTLIGWKEDLNMVFESPIPAQQEAVSYLEKVVRMNPGKPVRLVGHSKGGNLSVYAASACSDKANARLHAIVSHDGPGQSEATLASAGYARIRDRLRVYIPHFSLVGILLAHENSYTVVQSDAKDILQHDAFSWQMQGTHMVYAEAPDEKSLKTNRILREWMDTLDVEQQKLFVEAIYEIASATYGDTVPEDIETSWPQSAQAVFTAVLKLEPSTRSLFTKGIADLFSTAIKSIRLPWHKDEEPRLDAAETMKLPGE